MLWLPSCTLINDGSLLKSILTVKSFMLFPSFSSINSKSKSSSTTICDLMYWENQTFLFPELYVYTIIANDFSTLTGCQRSILVGPWSIMSIIESEAQVLLTFQTNNTLGDHRSSLPLIDVQEFKVVLEAILGFWFIRELSFDIN